MTQVVGFRAQGPRDLLKFFNVTNLFKKPFFGAMDFLVGLLELISELSKLLSFSFRLFGNIFAGSVLIFIVGSMVPIFAQSMILMFEFFIGLIQAIVFGMLTMIFMSQATQGHGEHERGARIIGKLSQRGRQPPPLSYKTTFKQIWRIDDDR